MEKRTCAIICFIFFLVTFAIFLTAFCAPYWADTAVMHAGVWQTCVKGVIKQCLGTVQAQDMLGKAGVAQAFQALMCLALVAGFAAGVVNMIWIIKPDTGKLGLATCILIIVAGLFTGVGVAVFGLQYSEAMNALSLLTGTGSGTQLPTGWAYYLAIASTTMYEVLGMAACCCACQGDGRVGQGQDYGGQGYGGQGQRHGRAPGGRGYSHPRSVPSHHDMEMSSMRGRHGGKAWHTGHGVGGHDPYYPDQDDLYYGGPQRGGYGYGPPPPVDPAYPPPYGPKVPPPSYNP